jgi:hypothetical protein
MISKKAKGLFIEVNGFSYLFASVNSLNAPLTIEGMHEVPRQEPGQLREQIEEVLGQGGNRYMQAHCSIVPESRFFRLHTVESLSKAKSSDYFVELMETQFRIDPEVNRVAVLSARNGAAFNTEKPAAGHRDLLLAGAESREFDAFQSNLIECRVFPRSLQLGTLSSLAGLKHYLRFKEMETPVLFIEMTQHSANLFILTPDKVDLCRPINFGYNSVLPVLQQELGLKDEESARNLFFSDTFDFREIGSKLLRRLLKELQASSGFYEVQTGMTIPHLYMGMLPSKLSWVAEVIADHLEMELLVPTWETWLDSVNVTLSEDCSPDNFNSASFGLCSMLINFEDTADAAAAE